MADATERLLLQVDAATELLRRHLAEGEAPLERFERRAAKMADTVDQSIAGMGKRFGAFGDLAQDAATRAQRSFEASFSDVQKLAAKAIQGPTITGGINIGAGDAKAAAESAQRQAVATRLIADAADRAAAGEGVLTEQTRLYVQAARAASIEAEQHANNLTKEAGALERVEIELQQAGAASRLFGSAQRTVTTQSGAQRAAMTGLSYQIQDTFTQLSMGANAFQVVAIQGGQAAGQFANLEGKAGSFARFMIGPYGLAITAVLLVMGPLVDKVVEYATGSEKAAAGSELHREAAARLKEAVDRLNGSQASLNHTTRQGIQDDLDAAEAKRQHIIRTRQLIDAQLVAAKGKLDAVSYTQIGGGGTVPGAAGFGQEVASRRAIEAIEGAQKINDKKLRESNTAIAAGRAKIVLRDVAASTDKATAANNRYEDSMDRLQRKFERGGFGNPRSAAASAAFGAEATRVTRQRDTTLDGLKDSKRRGPSADTLARRAEAARVADINLDIAFTDAERQARHRLLDATRKTTASEADRDKLLREDIEAEATAQASKIRDQQSAKKLSKPQADSLLALNESTRKQRLQNIDIDRASSNIADIAASSQQSLQAEIATEQVRAGMATTIAARRATELRILDLTERLEKQVQQAVLDDPKSSDAERKRARAAISAVDAQHADKVGQIVNQTASPLDAYRQRLHLVTDDTKSALEDIGVNALGGLEDKVASAAGKILGLKGAFGEMVESAIADLARLAFKMAVIAALDAVLPGSGSVAKLFGRASGGKVEGKAGGGRISGPGTGTSDSILALIDGNRPLMVSNGESIVTAEATAKYWPLIDAMNNRRLPGFATGGYLGSPSIPNLRSPTLPRMTGMGSRNDRLIVETRSKIEPSPLFHQTMQATAFQAVSAAAEPIMAGATSRTITRLQRPELPGGLG